MNESEAKDALRKAAQLIDALERRIEVDELAKAEPIAIVGLGCRFPAGIHDLASFWQVLERGLDAVGPIPVDRFDIGSAYTADVSASNGSVTRDGAFIDNIRGFDADFFGVSPREAAWIDPQHRLLAECAWEALEHAGLPAERVHGSRVGVFVGIGASDYGYTLALNRNEPLEGYFATGTGTSFSAGRVSFLLGLNGPSIAVDTACSSSLVALHLACRALRARECDVALAGGVQVMLSAQPFILLSRLRALAPDGRCKSFSADADGYGRGEGCGVLALKRLSDAHRDGDPILALVRGTAVNHDGASSGLTTPNGRAQQAVVEQALEDARLVAADVDYVEAHGTGTPLGDPIEVEALAAAYGHGRGLLPLRIGSVKSNLGHLESAAGISGVIKVIACLQHEALTPSLHSQPLNPHVDWHALPVRVVHEVEAWPRSSRIRRAGVSSFGMSGTNAHVVLEEAPVTAPSTASASRSAELIVLSARTPEAVNAAAARLHEHLESQPGLALSDLAYSLMTTRTLMDERLVLATTDRSALLGALLTAAQGQTPRGAVRGRVQGTVQRPKLAWLFAGQGAQQRGMGQNLWSEWPAFREALDAACALIDPELDRPLREIMWAEQGTPDARLLDQTAYTQPAMFALEWALAALWRSLGVKPDLVAGHSIGEITAACVAGVFSLPDAARLVCARGRLMQLLPEGGAMTAIAASEADIVSAIVPYAETVAVAAINGPMSGVISGRAADVFAVAERFALRGIRTQSLAVSHAFHSPLMTPILREFRKVAESIIFRAPEVRVVSSLTGALAGTEVCTAGYWIEHVQAPVRFAAAVRALSQAGVRGYVEIGPRATLLGLVPACLTEDASLLIPSLRSGRPEAQTMLEGLAAWIAVGGAVSHRGLFPSAGHRVELPTYAWQRKRHWIEPSTSPRVDGGVRAAHPLLGTGLSIAGTDALYECSVAPTKPEWLADHRLNGRVVMPGAALAELLRAAAAEYHKSSDWEVSGVVLRVPLLLEANASKRLQVIVNQQGTHAQVYSRATALEAPWTLHATAELSPMRLETPTQLDIAGIRGRCPESRDVTDLYEGLDAIGLNYGPTFQGLRGLDCGQGEALAEVALNAGLDVTGYGLHPALMDAALQAVVGVLSPDNASVLVPFEFGKVTVYRPGVTSALVHVRRSASSMLDGVLADLTLAGWNGDIIAELSQVSFKPIDVMEMGRLDAKAIETDAFYRLNWTRLTDVKPSPTLTGRWIVVASDDIHQSQALVDALRARGASSDLMNLVQLAEATTADHVVCLWTRGADNADPIPVAVRGLRCVQVVVETERTPRLWWLTERAIAVTPGDVVAPELASIWGLGRTVMQEHPELRCTLLDVDSCESVLSALLAELNAADDEHQVAWRQGGRYAARLAHSSVLPDVPDAENYQLEVKQVGSLESLSLTPIERRAPGDREVELEVRAAGLNFRDVLGALGMYPGGLSSLGSECAGVVVRVGAGVKSVSVGDSAMALALGAFRCYVTVDERLTARVPKELSLLQAATVPIAFLTAWYALHDLAALQPGETLLVHAAAGGVGMAAVQVAQHLGVNVVATASESKWDVVRSLGVTQVANSRDLSFVRDFKGSGARVDVVLNSLAGEFIDASLSLLSPGGRFLEMGKTDIREQTQLAATNPGVAYTSFDLMEAGLDRIATMFAAICESFASGRLKALPVRAYAITDAQSAFRYMAQAQHVGKLALQPIHDVFRRPGTVLVTGGLGALGLEVARTVSRRGIKHLLLVGRRGPATPDVVEALSALREGGTQVTVAALDVTDRAALAQAIDAIPVDLPLRGIVHAAATLDDGLILQQTPERFARVMAAKALGALNLDQLTHHSNLDLFVSFSSIAGTLGSAGQSGYAAGNAYVDGLAAHRRSQGRAATSLAWGPWSSGGMAAALDPAMKLRIKRRGILTISPSQGGALFEATLRRSDCQQIIVLFDKQRLSTEFGGSVPQFWSGVVGAPKLQSPSGRGKLDDFTGLAGERLLLALTDTIRREVARVLSLGDAAAVPFDRPLKELGLDSLMAVELRSSLQQRLGVRLPANFIFDRANAEQLSHLIAKQLEQSPAPATHERTEVASRARTVPAAICEPLNHLAIPSARLFCFHDAGGSANMFMPFLALSGIEIHAISHSRHLRASQEGAREYVEIAAKYVLEHSDRPYAFFGHSLGSSFAWRVAQELASGGETLPMLYIPSALPPREPGIGAGSLDLRAMLDPILRRAEHTIEKLDNFRKDFEADLELWEALPREPCPVLNIPILALLGSDDAFVTRRAMAAWSRHTTAAFSMVLLQGDHFYVHQMKPRQLLLDTLAAAIKGLVTAIE